MKNKSILFTGFASMYNLEPLAKDARKWMIKTKDLDTTQEKYVKLIDGITPLIKTPISECFNHIKTKKLLDTIYYISCIMNKHSSIPEVLTIPDISIYGKVVPGVSDKELHKTWLNISSMLSPPSKSRYADLSISSTNEVMAAVVRALMIMSYVDSKEWLNPKLSAFVIEVYTFMMKMIIDRLYKLDLEEGAVIKYAFAYYYAYLLNEELDENNDPILLQKCTSLFKSLSVSSDELSIMMKEVSIDKEPSLKNTIEFIKAYGPSRVKTLNTQMIYRAVSISSQNNVSTWLSIDYPPYLVYLLFISMSGTKHPILSNVINNILDIKYVRQNVDQMLKYANLYNGVNVNG